MDSYSYLPHSDGAVIGSTNQVFTHSKQPINTFSMTQILIKNVSLIIKRPLYDSPILIATKNSLFCKTSRNQLISNLCFLFLFFLLLLTFHLKNSLFLFLLSSFQFFIEKGFDDDLTFG